MDRYDQICKSVLWYKESKECVLNDKAKNDTDAIFVEDPEVSKNIDYYEKFCDIKKPDGSFQDSSPLLIELCFRRHWKYDTSIGETFGDSFEGTQTEGRNNWNSKLFFQI